MKVRPSAGRFSRVFRSVGAAPRPRQDGEGALWQGRDPWGDAVHVRLQGEKGGRAGLLLPVRIETAKKHSLVAAPL